MKKRINTTGWFRNPVLRLKAEDILKDIEDETKEKVAKVARELDPIVREYPCVIKGCSDATRMSCNGCDEYCKWIDRLKGE